VSNLRKIKDPLYGYIYYSAFEEKIISHPLVLRLHHIRQNGAAFLTYPNMRVHRFEHSLGAMHVAGLLFKSASEFSNEEEIDHCLREIIQSVVGKDVDEILEEIRKASNKSGLKFLTNDSFYKYNCLNRVEDPSVFARLLMFESVRIAALVHDIGHPPFSHTFETALKQIKPKEYSSHEIVGLELLGLIIDGIWKAEDGPSYFYAKSVLKLVNAIIDKKNANNWRVPALHEIISGDIDADRLDYVRRDTLSSGSSTNAYDLGRLIDAVRFKCHKLDRGYTLTPIMTTDALSTIEAFFNVRFHLYRWMLWHHNVVRMNLALILSIKMIVELSAGTTAISGIAREILDLALNPKRRSEYWYFADYYLLDKLSAIMNLLEKSGAERPAGAEGDGIRLLHRYLRTFLYREKYHLRPLWKRPDDYVKFGEHVTGETAPTEGAKALNDLLKSAYIGFSKSLMATEEGRDPENRDHLREYQSANVEYLSGTFCTRLEGYLSSEMVGEKVQFRAYYLAKFKPAPDQLLLHNRDGDWNAGYDIGVLSPSIRALGGAWEGLPHLWLFVEKLPGEWITLPEDSAPKPVDLYPSLGAALKRFLDEAARGQIA
jgi:hypothetical protein